MRQNVLILGHNYATQFVDIFNQYSRIFDRSRYTVTVAYLTGEPNDAIKQRTFADHVLFLNFPQKKIRYFKIKAIKKLLALTKENKYQIVICHRYKPIFIMAWVAQFIKIPRLIAVMHELRTMQAFGRRLLVATLTRKNFLYAGVSNAVRDDLRQSLWFLPKQQIVTLYNMIDVELIEKQLLSREDARKALGVSDDAFLFGNIARLAPNKDQTTLINAFNELTTTVSPQTKLIIMGDGELENSLKLKANRQVIFTGFMQGAFRYLKAFDCFVLSSIQEAFGRVLLEAMIAKIPIIATRVNGIPEVLGDVGFLITPREQEVLSKTMRALYQMSESERIEFGLRGYERANKHFSIPQFSQDFWQSPFMRGLDFAPIPTKY